MTQQEAREFWIAIMQYRDSVADLTMAHHDDEALEQRCDRQLAKLKVLFKDATGHSANSIFGDHLLGDPVQADLPKMRSTMYNFD